MITEQINFTLKKWHDPKNILMFGSLLAAIFLSNTIGNISGWPTDIWIELLQLSMIGGVIAIFRNYTRQSRQIDQYIQLQETLEAQLQSAKSSYAAQSKFIENIGDSFHYSSQEIFDAAEFLNAKSNTSTLQIKEPSVEQLLLSSAEQLHELSSNIVEFSNLRKRSVSLVEQKIDPVELTRFCISNVEKKNTVNPSTKLNDRLERQILITGDLAKMKTLLINLISSAKKHVENEDKAGRIKVSLQENKGLAITVKLSGYHLSNLRFKQLCSPLNHFTEHPHELDLELAIAKELAKLHGGDIIIESHTPSGTILALFLPSARITGV